MTPSAPRHDETTQLGYGPFVAIALLAGLLLLVGGLDTVEVGLAHVRQSMIDITSEWPARAYGIQPIDRRLALLPAVLLGLLAGPALASRRTGAALLLAASLAVSVVVVAAILQSTAAITVEVSPLLLTLAGCLVYGRLRLLEPRELRPWKRDKGSTSSSTGLMRQVVENSFDAVIATDEDGTVVSFNRAAEQMFRRTAEQALGRNINQFVRVGSLDGESGWILVHTLRDSKSPCEATGLDADGGQVPVEMTISSAVLDGVRKRVVFLRDNTWRKAQENLLHHQANHDALTDLPNRSLLHQRLQRALLESEEDGEVAFLLLDLDRFKEVNDTLGHHTGDQLLQQIARRLTPALRSSETLARFGGDEFAILLPRAGEETARRVASELRRALTEPFMIDSLALRVDATIGITVYPRHAEDPVQLVQRADVAMYEAKRARSGLAVYDPEKDSGSMRRLQLISELRVAIENEDLSLVYQPKIDATTGDVTSVEALCRWIHPELGFIPPDEFIDLAEHTGLIGPLTGWVMRTAMHQCARWNREGRELGVSINVSARNLLEEGLIGSALALLEETRLDASRITLEITENAIMEDPDRAYEVVTELARTGFGISIDDFGTGYSSLSYLRRLPAGEIKIDRCFVREMDRSVEDSTIVRSTIELAHSLGRKVVAEGVETMEVWDLLCRQGCDVGQGYVFSKPLPADELEKWLANHESIAAAPV